MAGRAEAATVIQSRVRGSQQRQKVEYESVYNIYRNVEAHEEQEFLAQKEVAAAIESYLKKNAPQAVRAAQSLFRKRKSTILQGASDEGSVNLSTLTLRGVHKHFAERWKKDPNDLLDQALVNNLLAKAYEIVLKEVPCAVVNYQIPKEEDNRLIIVGDTHGQLEDVFWMFYKYGAPTPKNVFIFNGDICDRGPNGVEIWLLLLAYKIACPECIFFNRGNHEDPLMNERSQECGGGFARECRTKYGQDILAQFHHLFDALPLVYIVNKRLMIVHGGLFRTDSVNLPQLARLQHRRPCPEVPRTNEEYAVFDALWSDPRVARGRGVSKRGGDCMAFGPDVSKGFLDRNRLDMIVRSHEVPADGRGFQVWHDSRVVTIFSASNYCGTMNNYGGVMILKPNLEFEVFEHWAPELEELRRLEAETASATQAVATRLEGLKAQEDGFRNRKRKESVDSIGKDVVKKVKELIVERKEDLFWFYETHDHDNTHHVSATIFWQGLRDSLGEFAEQNFQHIQRLVAPETEVSTDGGSSVDYHHFLGRFQVQLKGLVGRREFGRQVVVSVFQAILRADLPLREMFALFDRNCSGTVTFDEFREVLQSFDLGLSRRQLAPFFRALLRSSADKSVNIVEFFSRFDVIYGGHLHDNDEPWIREVLQGLGKLWLHSDNVDQEDNSARDLLEHFEQADVNGNGTLSLGEFVKAVQPWCKALQEQGVSRDYLTPEKLDQVARAVDVSGEGTINYLEWVDAFQAVETRGACGRAGAVSDFGDLGDSILMVLYRHMAAVRRGLQYFDPKATGIVSAGEFKMALTALASALAKPDPPYSDSQVHVLMTQLIEKGYNDDDELNYHDVLDAFAIVDSGPGEL